MGYRELLKKYVRFLELHAGDNFIESIAESSEALLTERDLGELRTLAAEIFRESHGDPAVARVDNFNYRVRILLNRYGLTAARAAELSGFDEETIRRWRTHPRSRRYLPMSAEEFTRVESCVQDWLNAPATDAARPSPADP
ncbi:MAG TPA: hypothetical protein VLA56_10160 [Pseudomonadales bacterium]|nr:hypothetical protein [Pseudomonadales bacterium]